MVKSKGSKRVGLLLNSGTGNKQLKEEFVDNRVSVQMNKHHHDSRKKKYLKKGLGDLQVRISVRQIELINQGMERKAARRQAAQEIRK